LSATRHNLLKGASQGHWKKKRQKGQKSKKARSFALFVLFCFDRASRGDELHAVRNMADERSRLPYDF
jgi:hypothetical protein